MNKKSYGIVMGIFVIIIGVFLMVKPQCGLRMMKFVSITKASVSASIDSKETSNTVGEFNAKKADELRIKYSSNIKKGTLRINLYCGKKIIKSFDTNVKGEEEITIDEDGSFSLRAEYENFRGQFKAAVYK